jgi:FkbM family methyltransferase
MVLKQLLKRLLILITPRVIKRIISHPYEQKIKTLTEINKHINLSYSQEGEDLVMYRLLNHKSNGFYVDIGAHHPFRFSNTYKFYLLGWNGMNIDPLPGIMKYFQEERPRDINLEIAINSENGAKTFYYMFDEPAYNTLSEQAAKEREKIVPTDKVINVISIPTYSLGEILHQYIAVGQEIDFFSIDVEGMDFDVIKSNDWSKFKPKFIILESLNSMLKHDLNSDISIYLSHLDYRLVSKTANSLIFKRV